MTLGLNYAIAPKPTEIVVGSQSVANILSIMGSLPRDMGDDRHIGVNEWVDRVRLVLSEKSLYNITIIMWGLGVEGLLNSVDHFVARDNFDVFLDELNRVPATTLRDTCLHWLINSTHRAVYVDAEPLPPVSADQLLRNRDTLINYLRANSPKKLVQSNIQAIADLYFDPERMKSMTLKTLRDLWERYYRAEWARHETEINRVVEAFAQVDLSGMGTFEALQTITGRDLRPIFRTEAVSKFEQIICVPSKHNGPYIMWFGDDTLLYIIFTARMPSLVLLTDIKQPNLNVMVQRFKALSDENRIQVFLAIREQGELSTQDIIEQFDLNKSAASRYLGQLFANGFLKERRDADGKTKYYSIDNNMVETFIGAIAQLLKE